MALKWWIFPGITLIWALRNLNLGGCLLLEADSFFLAGLEPFQHQRFDEAGSLEAWFEQVEQDQQNITKLCRSACVHTLKT